MSPAVAATPPKSRRASVAAAALAVAAVAVASEGCSGTDHETVVLAPAAFNYSIILPNLISAANTDTITIEGYDASASASATTKADLCTALVAYKNKGTTPSDFSLLTKSSTTPCAILAGAAASASSYPVGSHAILVSSYKGTRLLAVGCTLAQVPAAGNASQAPLIVTLTPASDPYGSTLTTACPSLTAKCTTTCT